MGRNGTTRREGELVEDLGQRPATPSARMGDLSEKWRKRKKAEEEMKDRYGMMQRGERTPQVDSAKRLGKYTVARVESAQP